MHLLWSIITAAADMVWYGVVFAAAWKYLAADEKPAPKEVTIILVGGEEE